ncbi:MAG: histidine kinase dimerization/phospho-acceptor domain-containing protein [Polyangiaceae bacterium]
MALAAALAHEVNNPLAYVLTNLDFVREQLSEECDADLLVALEEARRGALRIGAIVRGLQLIASGAAEGDDALDVELGEIHEPACALVATKPRRSR